MQRRSFLRGAGGVVTVAAAGCLSGDETDPNTVLGPPEREVDVDPEALAYPAYGEELPDVTFPSPLHETEVSTREFAGSRETLVTFVFTRCMGPCPALTATLAQAQTTADAEGYTEEVAFMPITFDPEHDTPDRLREFSELNGADPTAENWHFLRPATPERAQELIEGREQFGVAFEEVPVEESGHGSGQDGNRDTDQGKVLPTEGDRETSFAHTNLLLLANRDGYVERAYSPQPPRPDIVIDDLEAVRRGYE